MRHSTPGFADVLVGLQYGDEGKAKVIDLIAENYDIIARFNGGANAGHTIETDKGRVALHQVPSGIFYQDKLLYVGSGCVVDMCKMVKEIQEIIDLGIAVKGRLFISDQASVVQPHHILIDIHTGGTIGTTKNGIGPAYADKALRMDDDRLLNIKIGDLLDNPDLFDTVRKNLETAIKRYGEKNYDITQALMDMKSALESLTPFVVRDTLFLQKQIESGKRVLFEGANAIMLDITKGLVPFVTSSNTVAAAAYVGGDVPVKYHRKTIGVAKAIMSRVGNGPFVSEFGGEKSEQYCAKGLEHNKEYEEKTYNVDKLLASTDPFNVGIALRMLGNEYGSTTKRPRRIGMLDVVQIAYTAKMNGVDELFLTKCDLLIDFAKTKKGEIPLVTGYTLNGQSIDYVPGSNSAYRHVAPVVEYFPAFTQDISAAKTPEALPHALKNLLKKIEQETGTKLLGIGTGTKREHFVLFNKIAPSQGK